MRPHTSFRQVVSIDAEVGEAWGNMGALYMGEKNWEAAFHCFQAGLRE